MHTQENGFVIQYFLSFIPEMVLRFLFLEIYPVYLQYFSTLILSWNGKWLASVAEAKTATTKTTVSYENRLILDEFLVNANPPRIKGKDCIINSGNVDEVLTKT